MPRGIHPILHVRGNMHQLRCTNLIKTLVYGEGPSKNMRVYSKDFIETSHRQSDPVDILRLMMRLRSAYLSDEDAPTIRLPPSAGHVAVIARIPVT